MVVAQMTSVAGDEVSRDPGTVVAPARGLNPSAPFVPPRPLSSRFGPSLPQVCGGTLTSKSSCDWSLLTKMISNGFPSAVSIRYIFRSKGVNARQGGHLAQNGSLCGARGHDGLG